jgi:AcrR family transcriptional regulator
MDKTVFDSLKEILWEFFCSCLRSNPSNPKDQNYRKNLTTKDEKIIYAAKAKMPNLQKILTLAIDSVQNETSDMLKPEYIKQHFSECVIALERKAFNIYLKNEEDLFLSIIEEWVSQNEELIEKINRKSLSPTDFTKEVCKYFYPIVQRMEFDSSQTRKARGGKTFEHIVEYLLRRIDVPCQKPSREARKILKRVDLVVPDQETAIKRPDNAFFLSCKRTLRERWKQAIPERKPSWRVFLLAIDENLPEDKATEIDVLGMIVYVRDELKDKSYLQKKEWVRRLSELPKDIRGGIN